MRQDLLQQGTIYQSSTPDTGYYGNSMLLDDVKKNVDIRFAMAIGVLGRFFHGVPFIQLLKKSTYRFLEKTMIDFQLEGHDELPLNKYEKFVKEDGSKGSRKRKRSQKDRREETGEESEALDATSTLVTRGTSEGGSKVTYMDEGELSSLVARICKQVLAQQMQEGSLMAHQPASSQPAWDDDHPLMKKMCSLASELAGIKQEVAAVPALVEEKLRMVPAPAIAEQQLEILKAAGDCIEKLKSLELLTPEVMINEVRDSSVQLSKEVTGSTYLFRDGIQGLYINHNNEMLRVAESVADLTKAVSGNALLNGELLEMVEALMVMMQAEGKELPTKEELRDLKGKSKERESSQQVTKKDLDRAIKVAQGLEHAQVPPPKRVLASHVVNL